MVCDWYSIHTSIGVGMKKFIFCLLILFLFVVNVQATTYYLATAADGGSDVNNGLTEGAPWLTPNHAVNCGDVIIAKASTSYDAANFASGDWGTVTCAAGNNVAWLKCETFGGCKISANNVFAMWLSKSYWGVQGWITTGTGNGGVCYGVTPVGGSTIHHIIFANNICEGGANGFTTTSQSTTAGVDYIAIVGNIAWNASLSTAYCNSGITIYEPVKSDSVPGTHIYIAGNYAFDTVSQTNCSSGSATYDGNGIALDDLGWGQGGGTPYDQQVVVENNISVWNGGWGVATTGNGSTAAPIYIRYNTLYGNQKATNTNFTTCGDLVVFGYPDGIKYTQATNNLVQTGLEHACQGMIIDLYAARVLGGDATDVVASNFLYSAWGQNTLATDSTGFSFGSNTTGTDPQFTNPVDPGQPNCSGKTSVVDCMATVIANYTPQNVSARAYGYQPATSNRPKNAYFPQWLCNVNLPAGLITTYCEDLNIIQGGAISGGSL